MEIHLKKEKIKNISMNQKARIKNPIANFFAKKNNTIPHTESREAITKPATIIITYLPLTPKSIGVSFNPFKLLSEYID